MEFFRDAYSIRLLGHTNKYLWADEDRKSVSQKKGQDSYGAVWRVEVIPERNTIRLKSVYDLYLMASDYAFLLGATGKKVLQSFASKADSSLEWEPVSAGTYVKLKTKGDKFLRANGGMPPYRNSITHDVPVLASNQHVVLWEVEVVRKKDVESMPPSRMISPRVSNASRPKSPPSQPQPQPQAESSDDDVPAPIPANIPKPRTRPNSAPAKIEIPPTAEYSSSPSEPASPIASPPPRRRAPPPEQSPPPPRRRPSPLSESVPQRRRASPPHDAAFESPPPPRRRASPSRDAAYDASPPPPRRRASPSRDPAYDPSPPPRRRSSPSRDDSPPPRRRASQPGHDEGPPPRRRASPSAYDQSPPPPRRRGEDYDSAAEPSRGRQQRQQRRTISLDDSYDSSPGPSRQSARPIEDSENSASGSLQKVKSPDIRRIFYSVAEDNGEVLAHDDESFGTFMFKGHGLEELTEELQRVTGIHEDIILCMRNPLSAKLYKMRLALPPNKAPLSIVIVLRNSQFGRTFSAQTSRQQ